MVTRIGWHEYHMLQAEQASRRSTCSRLSVGAVIVESHHIVSSGFNGAPSGVLHCDHSVLNEPCEVSVHAEANALIFAGRDLIHSREMYVTHAPCLRCAGLIINAGIIAVYYRDTYRNTKGLDLLREGDVYFEQVK